MSINSTLNLTMSFADSPSEFFKTHTMFFGLFILITALFGLATNCTALWFLTQGNKLKCYFQQLCISYTLSNIIVLIVFLLYSSFYAFPRVQNVEQNSLVGKILLFCLHYLFNVTVFSHIMCSINRLIMVTFPKDRRYYLSKTTVIVMLASAWISAGIDIPFAICNSVLNADNTNNTTLHPIYELTNMRDSEYYVAIISIMLILAVNMWTGLLHIKNRMSSKPPIPNAGFKHFIQSVIQGMLYICIFICFFVFTPNSENGRRPNIISLFLFFWLWELSHGIDGLVTLLFHWSDYSKAQKEKASLGLTSNNQILPTISLSTARSHRLGMSLTSIFTPIMERSSRGGSISGLSADVSIGNDPEPIGQAEQEYINSTITPVPFGIVYDVNYTSLTSHSRNNSIHGESRLSSRSVYSEIFYKPEEMSSEHINSGHKSIFPPIIKITFAR